VTLFFHTEFKERAAEVTPLLAADIETGEILEASRPLEVMFGYVVKGELTGKNLDDLLPVEDRASGLVGHKDYAAHVRDRPIGFGMPARGLHTDGSIFPITVGLSGAVIGEKRCVIVVILNLRAGESPLPPPLPLAGE
jgi:PAS domain-containing protein